MKNHEDLEPNLPTGLLPRLEPTRWAHLTDIPVMLRRNSQAPRPHLKTNGTSISSAMIDDSHIIIQLSDVIAIGDVTITVVRIGNLSES